MPSHPFAFPVPTDAIGNHPDYQGMTLRDYFAGQALAGMCASKFSSPHGCYEHQWATRAYEFADAMLREREKIHDPS